MTRSRRLARSLSIVLAAGSLIMLSTGIFGSATPGALAAGPITVDQCNGIDAGPNGASVAMTCDVTVVNNLNGPDQGSTTTVTRSCSLDPCNGADGTFVSTSPDIVTRDRRIIEVK